MTDTICRICDRVKNEKPLVHCITNPISINQCANAILSLGAKPIMAEHPKEVCRITETSRALMLNIGNITDARMESIMLSAAKAKENSIPALLDMVGIACSNFRREYVLKLLDVSVPGVIKGNYSEIAALNDTDYFSPGVDAEPSVDEEKITKTAKALAKKYQTTILASGKIDIITDGVRTVYVKNGTPDLASVTGTGCMLGAICTAFMTAADAMESAVAACGYLGICGELAGTNSGNGSYMVNLMDRVSTLSRKEMLENLNVEEKQ